VPKAKTSLLVEPFLNPSRYAAIERHFMNNSVNFQTGQENESRSMGMLKTFALALAMVLFAFLASSLFTASHAQSSTEYNTYQQPSSVILAEVAAVRDVSLDTQQPSSTGQMAGGTIGGMLGTLLGQTSKNYVVTGAAATLGTVVGGYIGSQQGSKQAAQEIIIKYSDGRMAAITQSVKDGVRFAKGQQVMVIGSGRIAPLS
jgi:outer membrane lipoprotein SlyB